LINAFLFGAAIAEGERERSVYFVIKRESQRCNNRPRAETRGGFIMKRMILAIPVLVVMLAFVSASASKNNEQPLREEAVVEFTETVKLQGVLLRGQYLIFHDDSKMAAGEPCLYLYTMKDGKRDKLVTSLHCEPVQREKTTQFTVTFAPRINISGVREVREIQFAGIAKAHRIPS
jgi:hypothetical protein